MDSGYEKRQAMSQFTRKVIKDALNNGISFDGLMHDFKNAIEDAQNEIDKEKADTACKNGVNQCREDVIVAFTAYLDAIGVLDVDTVSEEEREKR